jgi:hypothetical protein
MTATVVLARARAAGLTLTAAGDRLCWRGPQPSPKLLAELKADKTELLRLLADPVRLLASPEHVAEQRAARRHAEALNGYRRAALQRPPSWPGADDVPASGCWCSCCHGRHWWREYQNASGWRCSTCQPPARPTDRLVEVRT